MSKEKKQEVIEAKKLVFHHDELKQSDPKTSNYNWISPVYNPGCLKRLKSNYNKFKKYSIQKELFYMRDGKKVIMSAGDTISFTSLSQPPSQYL
jgi:hypothetical protein